MYLGENKHRSIHASDSQARNGATNNRADMLQTVEVVLRWREGLCRPRDDWRLHQRFVNGLSGLLGYHLLDIH